MVCTVAESRRDYDFANATDFHTDETLIPTFDDLSGTKRKVKRLYVTKFLIGVRIEYGAVGKSSRVIDGYLIAGSCCGACSYRNVINRKTRNC